MHDLLNIDDVDFSDIADIAGSAELILARSYNPGQFKTACKSQAKEWLLRADTVLDSLSCGDAMTLTAYYEPLHQLAFSQAASTAKLDKYRLDAFESYIRGDKTVDQYALRHTISREIDRRNPKYFGRPLQWESVCLDRWHKQFRHGASLDELSDYDTLHRVSTLLTTDLWSFETRNESAFKRTLFENHRQYLELIHNASPMHNAQCIMLNDKSMHNAESNCSLQITNCSLDKDYQFLSALQSFLLASIAYLTQEEFRTCDTRIRSALIASPTTNRFHREALRLSAL